MSYRRRLVPGEGVVLEDKPVLDPALRSSSFFAKSA